MSKEDQELVPQQKSFGKLRIVIIVIVAFLVLGGGGAFAWNHFHRLSASRSSESMAMHPLTVIIPTIMSNLDAGDGRPRYVRINSRLQIADSRDAEKITSLMPQIQNAFQSYLHETRPEELSGSGIYRLREALLVQVANIVAPVGVRDLFFVEVLVQ